MASLTTDTPTIVQTEALTRVYKVGSREIHALRGIDLTVPRGSFISLRGRSGSGKTTLLNCIGGLDRPTKGRLWLDGDEVTKLPDRKWNTLRRKRIGFIFQAFSLMTTYSAAENVDLMLRLAGFKRSERKQRVTDVLTQVGLKKWMDHRPFEMSGGQQQRVAIARAIAPRPDIILADEPTGELDTATGQQTLHLLRDIVTADQMTLLVATHDLAVDAFADTVYHLKDGQIIEAERASIIT